MTIALSRVAFNLGIGTGATVGGFVVGSGHHAGLFQALYLLDAVTFVGYALVVLVAVPNVAPPSAAAEDAVRADFRTVARDSVFVRLMAANVGLVVVGYSLLGNILGPFAKAHTAVGPREIGVLFLVNTAFIVLAQLPATRVVKRLGRTPALAGMCALWALACLAVLPSTALPAAAATLLLAGVAIAFAIGECVHFIVLGPIVVDLAPPRLLGRYMSVYALTFTAGLALGPAIGATLLAASPDAVWWAGAATAALIGAWLLRLRIAEPEALPQPAVETA
jgi:MFS family permease